MSGEFQGLYVADLKAIDGRQVDLVGAKAGRLGELSRIADMRVPVGFCVTTDAFQRALEQLPSIDRLDELSGLDPGQQEAVRSLSREIRSDLERTAIPDDVESAIVSALADMGSESAYAVRSSTPREDSATTSFAGLHDTYLDIVGPEAILAHIRRCWASTFTERAVTYRLRRGPDGQRVGMAVVVQRMVEAHASGVLFTADPVNGNRKVVTLEAIPGLGEPLVSGRVSPDAFRVRDGQIIERAVRSHLLTDAQVLELERLGRRVESHFGQPQDVEWCFDGHFRIVQSRPITTLFPLPAADDDSPRVYLSVGHQQMMTDPMKPLGMSFWQLTAAAPMHPAGGRLFVDAGHLLASPTNRDRLVAGFEKSDPLTGDALRTLIARDFIPLVAEDSPPPQFLAPPDPIETDQAIVHELIAASRASVDSLQHEIEQQTGSAVIDAIVDDIPKMKQILFDPRSYQVFMLAMNAAEWLNEHLEEWLGEKNLADTLTRSVPNNVTSEMGLALLDVADVLRPHPDVIEFLRPVDHRDFLDELTSLDGGPQVQRALQAYLEKYGMRCVGEIDITRPRWSEEPSALVPVILANIDNFEAGEASRRWQVGLVEAEAKEREVLERLRALPAGSNKADETKEMIDRVRTFIGYREYPKYGMVSRYSVYKQALLGEAARLARIGVLPDTEDAFFLTFPELADAVRTLQVDTELIRERQRAFVSYQTLTPPRVLTSEGEAVTGSYRREHMPAGTLVGVPVSAGTVEGRARVIADLGQADLGTGDILVTAFTDPSWSPLFVTIKGLVTEVGGLMTHGAVIAREYGLPAVVGVERATQLIRDGQRIRIHGTDGFVELLAD